MQCWEELGKLDWFQVGVPALRESKAPFGHNYQISVNCACGSVLRRPPTLLAFESEVMADSGQMEAAGDVCFCWVFQQGQAHDTDPGDDVAGRSDCRDG